MDLEHRPRAVASLMHERMPLVVDACRRHGVRALILFGSLARAEPSSASDIDLAVDFGRDAGRAELAFFGDIISALGTDRVDLVDVRGATPLVLRDIAVDGIALFEAEPGVVAALQVAAVGRYLDTAHFRRLRSELLREASGE